jgi:hypothetical protein
MRFRSSKFLTEFNEAAAVNVQASPHLARGSAVVSAVISMVCGWIAPFSVQIGAG